MRKHGTILRTFHSNGYMSGLFVLSKYRSKPIHAVTERTEGGSAVVGCITGRHLSRLDRANTRRNIVTRITTCRCTDMRSVLTGTERGKRSPFVFVLSGVRSPRGLNTVVHATGLTNTRKIVVPGEETINLASAITGASTNTLGCAPITGIAGLKRAVSRLGRRNV